MSRPSIAKAATVTRGIARLPAWNSHPSMLWDSPFRLSLLIWTGQARKPVLHSRDCGRAAPSEGPRLPQAVRASTPSETPKPVLHSSAVVGQPFQAVSEAMDRHVFQDAKACPTYSGFVGQPPLPRGQGLSTQPRTGMSSETQKPVLHTDVLVGQPFRAVSEAMERDIFRGARACPHPSGQARLPRRESLSYMPR